MPMKPAHPNKELTPEEITDLRGAIWIIHVAARLWLSHIPQDDPTWLPLKTAIQQVVDKFGF